MVLFFRKELLPCLFATEPPLSAPPQEAPLTTALAHANRLLARDPVLAEQQAAAILEAVPGHPEAELVRGAALRLRGDAPGARDVLAALAAAQPRSARTQLELGLALAAMAEDQAAIAAFRRATALAPGLAEAWRALGDMLMLAGDGAGADAAYARNIRAAVNDPQLMAAADALCEGRLDIAERLLKARLKIVPTEVAAIRMLAETATRLGRNIEAEHLLARCLELAPSFTAARHNYAIVLYRQNKIPAAMPHIEALLAQNPRDPSYRNLQAASLAMIGEYDRAITAYESVLKEFPRQPKIWLSYGHALRTAGRRADCVAAYQRCIALAPSMGEAYWSLANLKTVPFTEQEVAAMRAQLAAPGISDDDRFHLHFALGRALEQAGDFEDSFTHYAEGARLRRAQLPYDPAETTTDIQRASTLFTPSFIAARANAGCPDPAPIFVVGLPRSGSTLIEQVLSSHSAVEGTMELPEIATIARDIGKQYGTEATGPYPACLAALDPAVVASFGERYIENTRIHRKLGRRFFIDKMPNNWAHVGLIKLILPHAKIIDARRHPMATCFSAFKQHFARGQHFSYDLAELGQYYCDYVALMMHFDAAAPGMIHRVRYEDMVANTEPQVRALLDHCGLDFEPGCLRFWETRRAVRTASSEQVRQPIFTEGLEHWRHFAPWLKPLEQVIDEGRKEGLLF